MVHRCKRAPASMQKKNTPRAASMHTRAHRM